MKKTCKITEDGIFWYEDDVVVMSITANGTISQPKAYNLNAVIESITVTDPKVVAELMAKGIEGRKIHLRIN